MSNDKKKCPRISSCGVPKVIKNQGESSEALPEERRQLRLAAISRADFTEKILENDRVCGDHFHSGKAAPLWDKHNPDWVHHLILVMTSSTKVPQRSLTQQPKWKELNGSPREEIVSSNNRKMSSNKK